MSALSILPMGIPSKVVARTVACPKSRLVSPAGCPSLIWPVSLRAASPSFSSRSARFPVRKTPCQCSCPFCNLKSWPHKKLGIPGLNPTG